MAATLSTGTSLGLLLLRLPLGVIFVAHGLKKVVGEQALGVGGFADDLANTGIPVPYVAAVLTLIAEIGGGAIVILGLGFLSRIAGLALAFTMVVAIFMVHLGNGFFIPLEVSLPGRVPWGYEYNLALLGMSLCVAFAGPGSMGLWQGGGGGGDSGGSD